MHDREVPAGGEALLRHRVDLRAVEARREGGELIGADIETVRVGADERLVAGARAAGVVGIGRINHEQVERSRRIRGLAHRDENVARAGEVARDRVDVELQDGDEEALQVGIEVALRVGGEVAERRRVRAHDLGP